MKYDIGKFIQEKNPVIAKLLFAKPESIGFVLNDYQKDIINRALKLYGGTDLGISRILTKVFVKKILRNGLNPSDKQKPVQHSRPILFHETTNYPIQ